MRDLQEYWKSPNDGMNDPELYYHPENWPRSVQLCNIIRKLIPAEEEPSILEIGCNVGRNLIMLYFAQYSNLAAIEISHEAICLMRKTFPASMNFDIKAGAVEERIYDIRDSSFDIVFTMAVLQHLPSESEHVFAELARVCDKYLITIEDEKHKSWRHFPRRYDTVFADLGMKQVKVIKKVDGLSSKFCCRIFRKEN